jgi:hypothetical protein
MTVTADAKKRVVVPGAKPGDVFACEQQDEDHFVLVRLVKPPRPVRRTRAEVRRALKKSKLRFDVTWNELRTLTREP